MVQTYDDCLAPAVEKEIPHGVPQGVVKPEATKCLLEISEATNGDWLVRRSAQCSADECGDRRGNPRDGVHATWDLIDEYAWGSRCYGHGGFRPV